MSDRLTVSVISGVEPEQFLQTLHETIAALSLNQSQGTDRTDISCLHSHSATSFLTQPFDYCARVSWLLGLRLGCLRLVGRIQEGSLWDFSYYRGDTHLGTFSTWPEAFELKAPSKRQTRAFAKRFAEEWGVPLERVERYLLPWGMKRISEGNPEKWWLRDGRVVAMNLEDAPLSVPTLKGNAYPTDKYEYGDIWQLLDFLTAIGSKDPQLLWDKPDKVIPVYFPSDQEFRSRYEQIKKTWFSARDD